MELHKAIKSVLETDGIEILKDVRLINILSDLQSFETMPACKYILRSVIADGYAQKLIAIGAWNHQSENLCSQFIAMTGFQVDYARAVFQSLAFGLGYIVSVDNLCNMHNQSPTSKPVKPQSSKLSLRYYEINKLTQEEQYRYKDAAEDYLNSITEIKGDWKKELGIDAQITSICELYSNGCNIAVAIEINGSFPKKIDNDMIAFRPVLYNKQGKILKVQCGIWEKSRRVFEIITCDPFTDNDFQTIDNIGKIVVFWE